MPPIPRIVVVDADHNIAPIVRGALALLSRQYIMVEVPSSEDALEEVANSSIDLVVTAYRCAGEMHGVELATRICHKSLGTPVIVLADEGDPQLEVDALEDAPFQYFVRPVAEPFLRGLKVALDGETVLAEENEPAGDTLDLGPVPKLDLDEVNTIVADLMRDAGAMGIILADRTGRVLIHHGATGYIDRETLAVLLGPMFARVAEVGPLVGGRAWTMHYYNGERLDVYSLALGLHYMMCLVFEASNRRALASVMLYGRRTADQIIELMGDTAYAVKKAEPLPPPRAEKRPRTEPVTIVAEPESVADEAAAASQEESLDDLEAALAAADEPSLEPVQDFDPEALFGQAVDESLADTMFDPDTLGDLAESIVPDEDERVGYDEAIDMGILDE